MRLIINADGTFSVEIEGATRQEVWQEAAFWQSLPKICSEDDKPVRFGYAKIEDDEFYYLESTGEKKYQFPMGTRQDNKKLFLGKMDKETGKARQAWLYWDGEKQVVAGQKAPPPQAPNGQPQLSEEQKANLEFERIGLELYGERWLSVRESNIARITKGGKPTLEHINRLIDGLKGLQAQRAKAGK